MRSTPVMSFALGAITSFVGVIVNYTILSDVFVQLRTLPIMVVEIGDLHLHHFILSIIFLIAGITLTWKTKATPQLLGCFLLGTGLVLLIDDFFDLVHFVQTGELKIG